MALASTFVMFACAASVPCVAGQFALLRRETVRLARGHRGRANAGRKSSPTKRVDVTPRAVSIYDVVRGEDDGQSTVPSPDSVPDFIQESLSNKVSTPKPTPKPRPTVPVAAPIVPPKVISSKAAMLASAEDLASGVDCTDECEDEFESYDRKNAQEGIVSWTVKYVDRALDDIEREKPASAGVAWKINREAEKVVRNPTVQRGAKLTADVGLEVVKAGVKAAAPVIGGVGKFAAKQAFGAAVGGFKNPLANDDKKTKENSKNTSPPKKKRIVKLTAEEAEAKRRAGKTVRKGEKKKGFFGM